MQHVLLTSDNMLKISNYCFGLTQGVARSEYREVELIECTDFTLDTSWLFDDETGTCLYNNPDDPAAKNTNFCLVYEQDFETISVGICRGNSPSQKFKFHIVNQSIFDGSGESL